MGGPPITLDGDEGTIPNIKGQDTTQTSDKTIPMCGPSYNKKSNKRPSRGVNYHGPIRTYRRIPRSMNLHNTGACKTKEWNKRQKGGYARQHGASRVSLQRIK